MGGVLLPHLLLHPVNHPGDYLPIVPIFLLCFPRSPTACSHSHCKPCPIYPPSAAKTQRKHQSQNYQHRYKHNRMGTGTGTGTGADIGIFTFRSVYGVLAVTRLLIRWTRSTHTDTRMCTITRSSTNTSNTRGTVRAKATAKSIAKAHTKHQKSLV